MDLWIFFGIFIIAAVMCYITWRTRDRREMHSIWGSLLIDLTLFVLGIACLICAATILLFNVARLASII